MSRESIYGTCLMHAKRCLPGDPALEPADLVQQAFAKVGDRLDTARPEHEQAAFLCRAIGQVAIDHARKLAKRPRAALATDLPARQDVEREVIAAADLAAALATPRRGLREAVLLGLGYTYPEIAAGLGLPVGTVKSNIHAARRGARGE